MEDTFKIINYDKYCYKCKYRKKKETDEPCNNCLSTPARMNHHRPSEYERDSKVKDVSSRTKG